MTHPPLATTTATLADIDAGIIPIALFILIALCVVFGIIGDTIRKVLQTRQREQSRREIAAYIAEGSMSPEDGVRLMAAGESLKDKLGVKL